MPTCRLQKIEQPKLSQNLREYIDELLGKQNTPVYPENGILKGVVETTDIEDNVFRKPIEPIQDFINKVKNNGTDYSVSKTNWEKAQEKIYTESLKDKLPMATEATENGMNDMSAAKRNPNATIYSSINDLEDKSLTEKFKKLETNENIKGVVYDSNSKEAKKVSNSKDFNNYVNEIINNGGASQKEIFEFKNGRNINKNAPLIYIKVHFCF